MTPVFRSMATWPRSSAGIVEAGSSGVVGPMPAVKDESLQPFRVAVKEFDLDHHNVGLSKNQRPPKIDHDIL